MREKLFQFSNLILLLIFILIASFTADHFLTVQNLINVLRQCCILGLLTVGMSFVLICGHMDLSIGSIMTFTGIIAISFSSKMPAVPAILSALFVGILCGLLNGFIVVLTHANSGESLMITFGTQLLFSALSLLYTQGFSLEGSTSGFYNAIGTGSIGKYLPVPVLLFITFSVILSIIESRTAFGRKVHITGFNTVCSHLSGIQTGLVKLICYGISGLMAGTAAIVLTSRTLGATPTAGTGYEMDAIVAAVLGGISLSGGVGSIGKAFVGVLTLGVLGNAMNLLGFQTFDQNIVKGLVLILAIAFEVWNRKQNMQNRRTKNVKLQENH